MALAPAGTKSPLPGGAPGAPGAMPGAGVSGAGAGGPTGTPMSTPQPMEGMQKAARVNVQLAMKMLQRELPHFEIASEQFKSLHSAIKTLSTGFGETEDKDRDLIPAEIRQLLSQVGPGSAPPGAASMAGAPTPGAGAPIPA